MATASASDPHPEHSGIASGVVNNATLDNSSEDQNKDISTATVATSFQSVSYEDFHGMGYGAKSGAVSHASSANSLAEHHAGPHGMDFGFTSWVQPGGPVMTHPPPGYMLHSHGLSNHPPPPGSVLLTPEQASSPVAAISNESPVDMTSVQAVGTASASSSVQGSVPPTATGSSPFGFSNANSDPLESLLGMFPCVKLRNLPFDATIQYVMMFFSGLHVIDIVISAGRLDGQGQGEAYVLFGSPDDFHAALQHRPSMGHSYIDVTHCKRLEFYGGIASHFYPQPSPNSNSPGGDNVSHASAASGSVWSEGGMSIPHAPMMLPHQHNPYYQPHQMTHSPHHQPRGGGRHASHRGGRGGRGYYKPNTQWQNGNGGYTPGPASVSGQSAPTEEKDHTGYLRMRGLPFASKKEDVAEFFKDFPIDKESVVFSFRSDGRATGEAYVSFKGPDEAREALTKLNRNMMGTRYIELFVSSKDEHRRMATRAAAR